MVYFLWVIKMPRTARALSSSNIYHVMLRGINRQVIFENDGDRHYFMTVLKYCKELSVFKLHAFCLMDNHIHLLIEPAEEPLETIFKRIGVRYVSWYNKKYQRVGHLFQDRFRSENVDNDLYYKTVLRYILQNPMKGGLEDRPGSFRWSSYLAYEKGTGSVTDTRFAIDLFGSRDALIRFVLESNDDTVMDEESNDRRLRDDWAQSIMRNITKCQSVPEFQQLERPLRKELIIKMHQAGLSSRQISRMTGTSKTTILKYVQDYIASTTKPEADAVLHESIDFCFNSEEIW